MKKSYGYMQIYSDVIAFLSGGAKSADSVVEHIMTRAGLSHDEMKNNSADSDHSRIRATVGSMLNQMISKKVIAKNKDARYYAKIAAPIALREERCEYEILKMLAKAPLSKEKIKSRLVKFFGTDKTDTKRDDNMLSTFTSDTLKRLSAEKIIVLSGNLYSIPEEKYALANDKRQLSRIKADFLSLLHSRGGEFFEYYFMNLLSRYLTSIGKTVLYCNVTGGSADGGIDGIAKTTDQLGFSEIIMVQTKNRTDYITEIDIRGFYGSVNAQKGTRGIFATTSGFHPMAKKLLDELDDCVGVDAQKIFDMAKEVGYGIITDGDKIKIDTSLI